MSEHVTPEEATRNECCAEAMRRAANRDCWWQHRDRRAQEIGRHITDEINSNPYEVARLARSRRQVREGIVAHSLGWRGTLGLWFRRLAAWVDPCFPTQPNNAPDNSVSKERDEQ